MGNLAERARSRGARYEVGNSLGWAAPHRLLRTAIARTAVATRRATGAPPESVYRVVQESSRPSWRTRANARASLRRARAPGLPALRDPRLRLFARSLRRVRARPHRRLLLQGPRLLSLLRRAAHGRHSRSPGGPRSSGGADPAVGALAPVLTPLPPRLRRPGAVSRSSCVRSSLRSGAVRGSVGACRLDNAEP
jgi:hypothetical protein